MAVMRAIFPNSSELQPMPADVQPNISGNANSHVGPSHTVNSNSTPTGISQNYNKSNLSINGKSSGNIAHSYFWWWIFIIFIVLAVAIILYAIKKEKLRR